MVPAGKYNARVIESEASLDRSQKGTFNIKLPFEIVDGHLAGELVVGRFYMPEDKEAAIDRAIQNLRTCGWKGDDITDLSGVGNNVVQIVVDEEEWPENSGKIRNKIRWVNDLKFQTAQMSDEDKAEFASRLKSYLKATQKRSDSVPF